MKNLLLKDLRIGVSPVFYVLTFVFGLLMFIPGWIYFLVPLYYAFVTVPNVLGGFRSSNDLTMSVLMPVRKKDIVKARMATFGILQFMHIVFAVIFAIFNNNIYKNWPFLFMRPNVAYFGIALIMYGIFNLIVFPIHYKTAYKYGFAVILGNIVLLVLATCVEVAYIRIETIGDYLSGPTDAVHLAILAGGIIIFAITGIIAYNMSVKNFEKVDI